MALVTLSTRLTWPGIQPITAAFGTGSIATVDAAGEYVAAVFVATEAMTVSHVGFRCGSATGSPTGVVSIETVDATTGLPTGTLFGTDTSATTATLTANSFPLTALTASASISAGQVFAVKVAYASGTSFQIVGMDGVIGHSLPYRVVNTGTPTKGAGVLPLIVLGSGATTFYRLRGTMGVLSTATSNFNNTGDAARALRFQVPFACRVSGIMHRALNAVGDLNAMLQSDVGAELSSSSTAFDGDINANSTAGSSVYNLDNPVTLAKDTWYRAVIQPSSATNANTTLMTLPSADYRSTLPGGPNLHYATFTTAGGWVDTATDSVPLIEVIIDQIDDGTGSGGAIGYATMSGGLQ